MHVQSKSITLPDRSTTRSETVTKVEYLRLAFAAFRLQTFRGAIVLSTSQTDRDGRRNGGGQAPRVAVAIFRTMLASLAINTDIFCLRGENEDEDDPNGTTDDNCFKRATKICVCNRMIDFGDLVEIWVQE